MTPIPLKGTLKSPRGSEMNFGAIFFCSRNFQVVVFKNLLPFITVTI